VDRYKEDDPHREPILYECAGRERDAHAPCIPIPVSKLASDLRAAVLSEQCRQLIAAGEAQIAAERKAKAGERRSFPRVVTAAAG
jgi:hypothetical protein